MWGRGLGVDTGGGTVLRAAVRAAFWVAFLGLDALEVAQSGGGGEEGLMVVADGIALVVEHGAASCGAGLGVKRKWLQRGLARAAIDFWFLL